MRLRANKLLCNMRFSCATVYLIQFSNQIMSRTLFGWLKFVQIPDRLGLITRHTRADIHPMAIYWSRWRLRSW